jgi:hypothetical protein
MGWPDSPHLQELFLKSPRSGDSPVLSVPSRGPGEHSRSAAFWAVAMGVAVQPTNCSRKCSTTLQCST